MDGEQLHNILKQENRKLREEVLAYLKRTGRAKKGRTYFGVLAANNPYLVARLENRIDVTLKTIDKVRAYMRENPPQGDA